jgi:hypothetical protein
VTTPVAGAKENSSGRLFLLTFLSCSKKVRNVIYTMDGLVNAEFPIPLELAISRNVFIHGSGKAASC